MFNIFRYLSMYEEFKRAEYLRKKGNARELYIQVQKWTLGKLEKMSGDMIPDEVRQLRNLISHAKPLIPEPGLNSYLALFHDDLPSEYRDNFRKSILGCMTDLEIPGDIIIGPDDF